MWSVSASLICWLTGVSAKVDGLDLTHLLLAVWLIWGVSTVMAHLCFI